MWLHADIKTLGDIPRYYGKVSGEKVALIAGGESRTFKELDQISNRIAHALIGEGIPQRSHIGFLGKNSITYFETLFGANKAGCAILPLNWRLTAAELTLVIDDARTPLVFADRDFVPLLKDVQQQCQTKFRIVAFDSVNRTPSEFDTWIANCSDRDPQLEVPPQDTALLIYTSGTTGKPKGVQLTHHGLNFQRLCEHLEPAYQWHPGDVMMLVMPCFHLVGSGLSIQGLYNGATVSILPAMDAGAVIDVIERDRPSICCLVPTAIQILIEHPKAATADFSSLRLVMYAGSPIGLPLLKRALTTLKCQFMQFYGATESSGALTLLRPEQHDLDNEDKLKSCGTPLPLIEIKVVGPDQQELPQGSIGEFLVRSPTMFSGYWDQPDATAAAMEDGWYHTGDAGFRDAEGLYYIVDRVKDMIVSGGENIYSAEVEQALSKHPAVSQAAVIGVPDQRWGEKVTAIIVLAAGATATEEAIIAHCRTLIAGYKVPKTVQFVQSLPMTPTGKILKRAIRDQFWKKGERAIG